MANLEIYCPNQSNDFRISLNIESKIASNDSAEHKLIESREKDRLTYLLYPLQVDLTLVKLVQNTLPAKNEVSFELEVELLESATDLLLKWGEGDSIDILEVFISTLQNLSRLSVH